MTPMLACDWREESVRFPLIAQPKIDGVRGINFSGITTGRSLKQFKNKHVTQLFTDSALMGFDGEIAAECETHPDLCRLTSSALGTIEGRPFVLWWLFDLVREDWATYPYVKRYDELKRRVNHLRQRPEAHLLHFAQHLRVVPSFEVHDMQQLLMREQAWLLEGYEGVILRDPQGKVKRGRSTVREGGLLRIKRFVEDEAVVISIREGNRNDNEAQTNELGKTFRSSHAENMVPNGQVGTLVCYSKKDNLTFNVSPGEMDVDTRKMYFTHQEMILGKTITFKKFPKGVKDKPRFPTFKCIREDL